MRDVPLGIAFIVSFWLEALIYGFFLCMLSGSLYVNLTLRKNQDGHSRIMFYVSILMFVVASMHVSVDCFRLVAGYVNHTGGTDDWLSNVPSWHHVSKDALYIMQEIIGDSAAIYRTYVVWGRNWKAIVGPSCLLVVSLISGCTVCALYTSEASSSTIFDPRLSRWINVFFVVSAVQSGITTSLMAYRIWESDRRTSFYRTSKENTLLPVLRILVESAAIQFVAELLLLSLYVSGSNAQFILLEPGVPLVGIAFCAITIRIAFRQSNTLRSSRSGPAHGSVEGPSTTIGSMCMRSLPISINITKDVEAHGDGQSDGTGDSPDGIYDRKSAATSGDHGVAS